MSRIRKPSPSLVVATLALFVALGGTGYAALSLPANSVGAAQLKKDSVNSAKVADGSLRLTDLKAGTRALLKGPAGATGPAGPAGATGAPGAPGTPATSLFAEISSGATPAVVRGTGVTTVTLDGTFYVVTLNRDISACVAVGTPSGTNGNNNDTRISVVHRAGAANALNVMTFSGAAGTSVTNVPFSLAVFCP